MRLVDLMISVPQFFVMLLLVVVLRPRGGGRPRRFPLRLALSGTCLPLPDPHHQGSGLRPGGAPGRPGAAHLPAPRPAPPVTAGDGLLRADHPGGHLRRGQPQLPRARGPAAHPFLGLDDPGRQGVLPRRPLAGAGSGPRHHVTVVSFNLVASGLREAMDPAQQGR